VVGVGVGGFRAWWGAALAKIQLSSDVLRPYSLRRGGATWSLQQTGSLEAVLFRGRWSSSVAARGYLQEGLALLAQASLSPESRQEMSFFHALLRQQL
jgi:hypothetical protein